MDIITRILPEPCYTFRRTGQSVPLNPRGSVIHFISGGGRWGTFKDDPFNVDRIIAEILLVYKVSYNYMIARDGTVYQLVPDGISAFHAGKSHMNGRNNCNWICFGVALVSTGQDTVEDPAYPDTQIQVCAQLHRELMQENNFDHQWIKGHDEVREQWNSEYPENTGKKKNDPGIHFPWDTFYSQLNT